MARPVVLTDTTFRDAVTGSGTPVLVFLWAEWNATCKALAPSITALAGEYEGRVLVAKLDIDANPQSPALFGVMNVPTLLYFANGQVADRTVGYRPITVIRARLDELLTDISAAAV